VRFGVLGTLEVVGDDGATVELGGAQARTVLAILLVAGGRVVPAEVLIDALWGEEPPSSAAGTLQSYVSRLRRALEPARAAGAEAKILVREAPGYRLDVEADDVDFRRFERLAGEGRALLEESRHAEARAALVEADALWRGRALLESTDHEFARGIAARLEERRVAAIEDRVEADLHLGRHGALVGELTELVDRYPLREGLRAHLALALYRSGRQAEALRALDDARHTLVEELGVEPSRPLRELGSRILDHDPALDLSFLRSSPGKNAGEIRQNEEEETTSASTLVGRRIELAQLLAALEESTRASRMALVEGEPGIGKTRLVEELATRATEQGAVAVWGRSHEGDGAPAFWPWLGALRSLIAAVPAAAAAASSGGVEQLLRPSATSTGAGAAGDAEPVFTAGPVRFELFEAVATMLAAAAAEGPLVILLDDLQWADQASLELLGFLAGRLVDEHVLVVGTVRELEVGQNDAVVDALAALSRRPGSRRLPLRGLDEADTERLLEQTTGQPVPPELAATIHARAEGNPFYATELARLLTAGDVSDVPAGVRDTVRRRLAQLPEATAELLRVCAVIGRDADLALLTVAAGRSFDDCLDDLDPAVVSRLVVAVDDQPGTFRFAHALVREVVLDGVSSLRRARLHLRVADAIIDVAGDADDAAEILAEHLWAAAPVGVGARAAEALQRAAEVAVRRLAFESASDLLRRAIALRRAAGSGPAEAEAELVAISKLRAVHGAIHGYAAEFDLFDRGKELAERCGRDDLLMELLWAEWAGADTACDFPRAQPIAEYFRNLAEESDDALVKMAGLSVWGIQCWHDGRISDSSEYLGRAVAIAADLPTPQLPVGFDSEFWLLAAAFRIHVDDLMGHDDVEARFEELAARQRDRFTKAEVASFACAGAAARGDAPRTERAGLQGMAADPDIAFTFWGSGIRMYLGWARMQQGDLSGREMFDDGLARYTAAGIRTALGSYLANAGIALLRNGLVDEAAARITEARRELETYGEQWPEPVILIAEAELAAARGAHHADVAALLDRAAAVATAGGAHGIARRAEETAARLNSERATLR